ncbi:hypothetical protein DACRYDRAFT_79693 [Dacryopinax primogenitus]|uniref:DDE-1 domain-containing protein n=1 Tax=Dacryopinax primogenitus (strain DJM 731) TaxID=1858805 RepID=M5G800_DACPD|nr:uncharacterized protein DACRYDRAFT_79693 [Dacryopinax primogenitus]EJU02002.1 hypothetical protein DACRYDRAFT_79693 [Dacryopinax primogenitus]
MGGTLLPFQSVSAGVHSVCLPFGGELQSEEMYEALEAGHLFSLSRGTYWSTHPTIHEYVHKLLAPYFRAANHRNGRALEARCIWIIDAWAVHRSKELRQWMHTHFPWIGLLYVPGGCTGVIQPADTGMQRPLKAIIRKAALDDVIQETQEQLKHGWIAPETIKLDVTLGTLRDRTVRWLLEAHKACNTPERVLNAWQICNTGVDDITLSYDCLTSPAMLARLDELPFVNEELYRKILPGASDELPESVRLPEDDEAELGFTQVDAAMAAEEYGNALEEMFADIVLHD